MRRLTRLASVMTGCRASTARGTLLICSINTITADSRPATRQAAARRVTSSKPAKRQSPRGTWAMANALT